MDYNDGFLPTTDLPYSLDAEQTILGAVLIDASVLPTVLEKLRLTVSTTNSTECSSQL